MTSRKKASSQPRPKSDYVAVSLLPDARSAIHDVSRSFTSPEVGAPTLSLTVECMAEVAKTHPQAMRAALMKRVGRS